LQSSWGFIAKAKQPYSKAQPEAASAAGFTARKAAIIATDFQLEIHAPALIVRAVFLAQQLKVRKAHTTG
jgi:hypothetical protein